MSQRFKLSLFLLLLIAILLWIVILTWPKDTLRVVACDVGQGDALLVVYKSAQILVDGGPNSSVLDCLDRHIAFWDRNLELIILTHPDLDHYGGLDEVLDRYQVNMFVTSAVDSSTKSYQALKSQVGGLRLKVVNPDDSTVLELGEIAIDVVTALAKSNNSNDSSVVFNLKFGEFDALFTGDIGQEITDEVIATGEIRDIEYLKVPHHGSKNGLTQELLNVSTPEVAVISVGAKNRYGHPDQVILDMLTGVTTLRTDQMGDIIVETDGKSWWIVQ